MTRPIRHLIVKGTDMVIISKEAKWFNKIIQCLTSSQHRILLELVADYGCCSIMGHINFITVTATVFRTTHRSLTVSVLYSLIFVKIFSYSNKYHNARGLHWLLLFFSTGNFTDYLSVTEKVYCAKEPPSILKSHVFATKWKFLIQ